MRIAGLQAQGFFQVHVEIAIFLRYSWTPSPNAYGVGLFINFYLRTNNNELPWKLYLLPGHPHPVRWTERLPREPRGVQLLAGLSHSRLHPGSPNPTLITAAFPNRMPGTRRGLLYFISSLPWKCRHSYPHFQVRTSRTRKFKSFVQGYPEKPDFVSRLVSNFHKPQLCKLKPPS